MMPTNEQIARDLAVYVGCDPDAPQWEMFREEAKAIQNDTTEGARR